jgi:hypothetical protein
MRANGFSGVAQLLTDRYGEAVTRHRVYEWWKRETRNAAGTPFPRELEYHAELRNVPNREFDAEAVLAWAEAGVPADYGAGYRQLGRE